MPSRSSAVPDLTNPDYVADPYPALNALRETAAVGVDATQAQWYVTRYDEVRQVLYDRTLSADVRKAAPMTSGWFVCQSRGDVGTEQISMLLLDEPEHARLRRLVSKAFAPRAVETMRPRIEALAGELLDVLVGQSEFDLMAAFAQPFPTLIIAEMIGVDPADQARFKAWSDTAVRSLDPFLAPEDKADVRRAEAALEEYFAESIQRRRGDLRDDLISRLITAQEDGDKLSDTEMVVMLNLLLAAGNVTTTDLIGNGMHALLSHREQFETLRRTPALVDNAVEEMLRYDSPVIETWRFSDRDLSFGGCPVTARQTIAPSLAAANRDPRHFPDPERFDIARSRIDHLSFGGGIHYCLGASLARLEAQVAVTALVERFPDLRIAEGREPVYRSMPGFRGLQSLWVSGGAAGWTGAGERDTTGR